MQVHLKWFMGTLVFSALHCRDFLFFLFSIFFSSCAQKTQKRIFYFCSLLCILYFCLVAFLCFLVLFDAFWCFLVLFVQTKSFFKRKKRFKTALITSFILLLFLATFYLILLHLSVQVLTLEIHSFS